MNILQARCLSGTSMSPRATCWVRALPGRCHNTCIYFCRAGGLKRFLPPPHSPAGSMAVPAMAAYRSLFQFFAPALLVWTAGKPLPRER